MPIPKPREGEEREAFISRFMRDPLMGLEYPDREQRYAVALSAWKKAKKG